MTREELRKAQAAAVRRNKAMLDKGTHLTGVELACLTDAVSRLSAALEEADEAIDSQDIRELCSAVRSAQTASLELGLTVVKMTPPGFREALAYLRSCGA